MNLLKQAQDYVESKYAERQMIEIENTREFEIVHAQKEGSPDEPLALQLARQSHKLRRSPNSATILLVGLSGSGKSHTVNNLFGKKIAKVSSEQSCTDKITRYTIAMPSNDLHISNTELHVIDTPGYGDTMGGSRMDAQSMAGIHRYFVTKKHLPNFIILTVNFNDKRLLGQFSLFVQMLKLMNTFYRDSVLDKKFPNLVVVLTHLLGANKKVQRDPTVKISLVKQAVLDYLAIPDVAVEVAENDLEGYADELPKNGDYHQLPNGDWYPQNIYLKMVAMASGQNCVDPIGLGLVNEAYRRLEKEHFEFKITHYPITMAMADEENGQRVDTLNWRSVEEYIFEINGKSHLTNTLMVMTEITNTINKYWDSPSCSIEVKCRSSLKRDEIGQKLGTMGYRNLEDLPDTTSKILSFYRLLGNADPDGDSGNDGLRSILRNSLGLMAPPKFGSTLALLIGKGFNVLENRCLDTCIVDPGVEKFVSSVGCELPENFAIKFSPGFQNIFDVSRSKEEVLEKRWRELNVDLKIPKIGYNFQAPVGFNVVSNGEHESETLSAVYEYRIFKFELINNPAPKNMMMNEFQKVVQNLPKIYVKREAHVWRQFFDQYGTHLVSSSFLGGSINFQLSRHHMSQQNLTQLSSAVTLSQFFFGLSHYGDGEEGGGKNFHSNRIVNVETRGGDVTKALAILNCQNYEQFLSCLQDWKNSILDDPVVTDYSISLRSMPEVVGAMEGCSGGGSEVAKVMREAMHDLFKKGKQQHENETPTKMQQTKPMTRVADSANTKILIGVGCAVVFLGLCAFVFGPAVLAAGGAVIAAGAKA